MRCPRWRILEAKYHTRNRHESDFTFANKTDQHSSWSCFYIDMCMFVTSLVVCIPVRLGILMSTWEFLAQNPGNSKKDRARLPKCKQ